MAYQYKMVQIAPHIRIDEKDARGQEAAIYLHQVVTRNAQNGWDFFRVDTIGISSQPGCLAALFGARTKNYNHYVITFRKQA